MDLTFSPTTTTIPLPQPCHATILDDVGILPTETYEFAPRQRSLGDSHPLVSPGIVDGTTLLSSTMEVMVGNVTPEEYISFKCLTGDKGDNVPGINGIGPKRAEQLIKDYGDAMTIYDNIPLDGKYKYIQELNQNAEVLLKNYELMDLITYCDDAIGTDNVSEIQGRMI